MTSNKKNIIYNGMKIVNKITGKNIRLKTARRYLREKKILIDDLEYDKDKLWYNINARTLNDTSKPRIKRLMELSKLPALYRRFTGTPRRTIEDISYLSNFLIKSYYLKYRRGDSIAIIQDIVDWTNRQLRAHPEYTKSRIIISARYVRQSTGAQDTYYVNTGLRPKAGDTSRFQDANNILDKLDFMYQDFDIKNATIQVKFYTVNTGGGSVKVCAWIKKKTKSVIVIENDDNLCGQRCLLLALLDTQVERSNIRNKKCIKKYMKHLEAVCSYMGTHRLNFLDFEKFVKYNPKYSITIMSSLDTIVYETENEDAEKHIYLYYDVKIEHYHLITNVESFVNDEKGNYRFCFGCKKRMLKTTFKKHTCSALQCKLCFTKFDNKEQFTEHLRLSGSSANCPHCNIKCRGAECLHKHINGTDKRKGCDGKNWFYECCYKQYLEEGYSKGEAVAKSWGRSEDKDKHDCNYKYCRHCDDYLPISHRCHIQPKVVKDKGLVNLIAFDFESWIDEETHKHTVMYIVAIDRLTYTIEEWSGKNSLEEFILWCLSKTQTTFIAHNGKAYDTWLIHHYITTNMNKRPEKIIMAGQKIMYMKFKSNCFIDSLNHFSCALDKLPDTFGLDDTKYKKGFYPYNFNTEQNWEYVGIMPDIKHFSPSLMSDKKYKEFKIWYNDLKNNNYIWNHKQETKEYCISDVKLLLEACNVYSKLGYELTDIDPLSKQTIASWVMSIYLTKHYPFDDYPIGVLNKTEYDFIKRSFHGGRTECIRLYRGWSEEEINNGKYGRYVDIQSLYPTTQYYDKLPYGIPEWIEYEKKSVEENNEIINNTYGYFEVDVEMNKNLFISPLVNKIDGKLQANVVDKKRQVYFSEELKYAIKDGCNITRIYKGLKFKYTDQLFKSFVGTFLEIKVNNSGKPKFWSKPNQRLEFITQHQERFGFTPEPTDEVNDGMRRIAKMILNSLWGKFGQRPDMVKTEYIDAKDVKKWYKLLYLDGQDLVDIHSDEQSGDCLFVRYIDNRENCTSTLFSTNIGLAAAVTGNASMRLYKELRLLQDRVLYHDTDSIIYEYDKNKYNVEEGNYLGDWESETGDRPITEMVGTGAKSYSYKVDNIQKDCKMKGICLNMANSKIVNFETLKYLVDNETEKLTTYDNLTFKKTIEGVVTNTFEKDITYTMDKRDRDGYYTYPRGYEGVKVI
jgi:hypothetical protein